MQNSSPRKATVIMFICNHCPFVKHVQHDAVRLAKDYQPKGVSFIALSANDAQQYPDDSPQQMKRVATESGYPFPYLYDQVLTRLRLRPTSLATIDDDHSG